MNILIFSALFFASTAAFNDDKNCKWKYECCMIENGRCVKMCEPQIICSTATDEDDEPAPFQVLNVKCKFGYRTNSKGGCRKVMK
jgi:hypothetical protein